MDILEQGVIDKGLVVPSSSCLYETPKIFQDGVVQPDGDLRLSGFRFNDGTALRTREVDIAILFSYDLFHEYPLAFIRLPSRNHSDDIRFAVRIDHDKQISKVAEAQSHKARLFHRIRIFSSQAKFVLQNSHRLRETNPVSAQVRRRFGWIPFEPHAHSV